MASIEDMIKSSKCFGIAYNSRVRECKICEVAQRCQRACENPKGSDTKDDTAKTTTDTPDTTKADVTTTDEPVTETASEPTPEEKPKASKTRAKRAKAGTKVSKAKDSTTVDNDSDSKPTADKGGETEPKKEKPVKHYSPDMPEFKKMSVDQLFDLLEERTDKKRSEFIERYKSKSILRMRLIMAIKKTYEVEV